MDSQSRDKAKRAIELWSDFKEKILHQNRFFVKHSIVNILESFAENSQRNIDQGTIFYRARLYKDNDSYLYPLEDTASINDEEEFESENTKLLRHIKSSMAKAKLQSAFLGYNKKDSFIPLNNNAVRDGRVNPAFITYLYTAEDPYTALVEVRPYLNSKISIAEIKILQQLRIADFSFESLGLFSKEAKSFGIEQWLMYFIMSDFSIPTNSKIEDYIPIQYVAELIKNLGFDGIRFNSSLHKKGRNITIFNHEKCEAISSKLYKVNDICFETRGLAPKNALPLIHEKLVPYQKQIMHDYFIKNGNHKKKNNKD